MITKRLIDIAVSFIGLILAGPVLVPVMILVWLQDFHSPFYVANRIGKNGQTFRMAKMRSMIANADKSGVDSTSANDNRITPVGHLIRKFKIDEVTQLWNMLSGHMSLVGPRPNVKRDVDLYTEEEKNLLKVSPGITDLSSIVFADEGDILRDHQDPDLGYNQLIRPWKSRLGLIYIKNQSLSLDLKLILLTIVTIFSRQKALDGIQKILTQLQVDPQIIRVAKRQEQLFPAPPPGSQQIVMARAS